MITLYNFDEKRLYLAHINGEKGQRHQILVRVSHVTSLHLKKKKKKKKKTIVDISCLTRDRFVHHTMKYKRVFNGDVSK